MVNSSWVAVQELNRMGLNHPGIQLVVTEIPVEYDYVKDAVPDLWKKYKPEVRRSIKFLVYFSCEFSLISYVI